METTQPTKMKSPPFKVPAAEVETYRLWRKAYDLWMGSLRSDNTRRIYRQGWTYFLEWAGKPPWKVCRSDVAQYVDFMKEKGLSPNTRHSRMASLSSFYTYVSTDYYIFNAAGQEVPLHPNNPAYGKSLRDKINPYGKSIYLHADQIKQLLAAIPQDTVQGKRDYALYLGYILTGRRNTELRQLRWGEIEESDGKVWYTWSGKGKFDQHYEMARPVWEAIRAYLRAAGRLTQIRQQDYIFAGASGPATCLSMREVGRLLKRYCLLAGLDPKAVHVHVLRHSAAMLREAAGDSPKKISKFLGHSNIATTFIYLDHAQGLVDDNQVAVGNLIGLGSA